MPNRIFSALAAMALATACTGTDTGNPFTQDLRVGAHSSNDDAFAIAVPQAGGVVTEAWIIVGGMTLVADGNCGDGDDGFDMGPVGATNSAAGRATLSVDMEDGDFCQLTLPIDGTGTIPTAAPPELGNGNGLVVLGTTAAGTDFTIVSSARTVALRGSDAFFLGADDGSLFLGFDVAKWLGGLDIDGGDQTGGRVIIDGSSNATLSAMFEDNLAGGLELYRDLDDNGEADPTDELLATGQ